MKKAKWVKKHECTSDGNGRRTSTREPRMRENEIRLRTMSCICFPLCVHACVCVFVRRVGAHTGHGSRGLTLSILLNGKPICEHFSSQRSRRLILEWVGLIHRLPPPPPGPRLHHHQHRHQRVRAVEFSRLEGPNSRFVCRTRVYDAPVHVLPLQRDSYGGSVCTCMGHTSVWVCCVGRTTKGEPTLWTCFLSSGKYYECSNTSVCT